MSEHEYPSAIPCGLSLFSELPIDGDGIVSRVQDHLMFNDAHEGDGYDFMFNGRWTPELGEGFERDVLSHTIAVLKGEISLDEL